MIELIKLMGLINKNKITILAIVGLISGICYSWVIIFDCLNMMFRIIFASITWICFFINFELVEKSKKLIFFLSPAVWYIHLLLDLIKL